MTADLCCVLCKGAHGICLSRYACSHHIEAQARDDADHAARQTVRRPTEDQAIRNIERADRQRRPK